MAPYTPFSFRLQEINYCTKSTSDVAKIGKLHWWKFHIKVHQYHLHTWREYRAVSGVFRTIDPPPPLPLASVSFPRTKGGGGGSQSHSPGGEGVEGQYLGRRQTLDWPLTIYSLYEQYAQDIFAVRPCFCTLLVFYYSLHLNYCDGLLLATEIFSLSQGPGGGGVILGLFYYSILFGLHFVSQGKGLVAFKCAIYKTVQCVHSHIQKGRVLEASLKFVFALRNKFTAWSQITLLPLTLPSPEPEFLNFKGAQESIPRNQFHQAV